MSFRLPPPTLIRLVLLGFVLVALPLIVAIVTAIVQVDGFAQRSQQALMLVQANTNRVRALADATQNMERTARQYQALNDAAYKSLFDQHLQQVQSIVGELTQGAASEPLRTSLAHLSTQIQMCADAVNSISATTTPPSEQTPAHLTDQFAGLRAQVVELTQQYTARARALSQAIPTQATSLQRLLITQAGFVIPLSVALATLIMLLMSRPLRQLDRAIRTLGQGSLTEPIAVYGARDLAELGQRLDWLRIRLLELEAQKSQFLRNVSHELKTPLTNIREAVELLVEKQTSEAEQTAICNILRNNSLRLQHMIEQLLQFGADGDISDLDTHAEVDMVNLVEEQLEIYTPDMTRRGIELTSDLQACSCHGSAKHLKVIVDNLLSNAVKYTPTGGRISVTLQPKDAQLWLDVADSGPGISPADAEHVFDWFYTGNKAPHAIVAGTGMGLAIAREYAQQHGGTIQLRSCSQGAHFRLQLPESTATHD